MNMLRLDLPSSSTSSQEVGVVSTVTTTIPIIALDTDHTKPAVDRPEVIHPIQYTIGITVEP